MNTNEPDLEKELRTLRPASPSTRLEDRIARDLGPKEMLIVEPRTVAVATSGVLVRKEEQGFWMPWLRGLGWALAGAVAAVAIVWTLHRTQELSPSTSATLAEASDENFLPAESEREILEADESGILYAEGEEPMRQVRFLSIERYAWTNPESGARVEVEVPREDIVLMPVAMQ